MPEAQWINCKLEPKWLRTEKSVETCGGGFCSSPKIVETCEGEGTNRIGIVPKLIDDYRFW